MACIRGRFANDMTSSGRAVRSGWRVLTLAPISVMLLPTMLFRSGGVVQSGSEAYVSVCACVRARMCSGVEQFGSRQMAGSSKVACNPQPVTSSLQYMHIECKMTRKSQQMTGGPKVARNPQVAHSPLATSSPQMTRNLQMAHNPRVTSNPQVARNPQAAHNPQMTHSLRHVHIERSGVAQFGTQCGVEYGSRLFFGRSQATRSPQAATSSPQMTSSPLAARKSQQMTGSPKAARNPQMTTSNPQAAHNPHSMEHRCPLS